MTKIEQNFIDSLRRINFIFRNEEVSIECVKQYDQFTLLGEKIGPFEQGKSYKLKFFKAIPFIENGILKIKSSKKYDNVDVQRFAIGERDDQRLVNRNDDFFLNKIKEFKKILEKDVNDKIRLQLDLDRYNSYTSDIIDSRLLKLLRLAKTELSLDDERRLTLSERLLFKRIYKLIDVWKKFLLERKN